MYYYYDYSWFVLIPAMIFTFICQSRINNAYRTYSQVQCSKGITGAQAARAMMDANGLSDITVNVLNGGNALTNFYDPKNKSLNLSRDVYASNPLLLYASHAMKWVTPYRIPSIMLRSLSETASCL